MICVRHLEICGKFALSADHRGKKSASCIPVGYGRVVFFTIGTQFPIGKKKQNGGLLRIGDDPRTFWEMGEP